MNSITKLSRAKGAAPKATESVRILSSAPRQPHRRNQMVEEAAYYNAVRRGFEPGHELEDWLAAESEIDAQLEYTDPSEFLEDFDSGSEKRPW